MGFLSEVVHDARRPVTQGPDTVADVIPRQGDATTDPFTLASGAWEGEGGQSAVAGEPSSPPETGPQPSRPADGGDASIASDPCLETPTRAPASAPSIDPVDHHAVGASMVPAPEAAGDRSRVLAPAGRPRGRQAPGRAPSPAAGGRAAPLAPEGRSGPLGTPLPVHGMGAPAGPDGQAGGEALARATGKERGPTGPSERDEAIARSKVLEGPMDAPPATGPERAERAGLDQWGGEADDVGKAPPRLRESGRGGPPPPSAMAMEIRPPEGEAPRELRDPTARGGPSIVPQAPFVPRVHIGLLEITVLAPEVPAPRSAEDVGQAGLSSRLYLRSL